MKVIIKHNGEILDKFGFGDIDIPEVTPETALNQLVNGFIRKKIQWRATSEYDFEYGIGGSPTDEYYKIKSIKFSDNKTNLVVKVSKVSKVNI
jgi:hypothetical protein